MSHSNINPLGVFNRRTTYEGISRAEGKNKGYFMSMVLITAEQMQPQVQMTRIKDVHHTLENRIE